MSLNTLQKGKCGELLVQYLLLKNGIESAPMTTDRGIDLVALSDDGKKTQTIQVKTTEYGDGGTATDEGLVWAVPKKCQANYIALVDVARDKVWLISLLEFEKRGTKAGGNFRLGWNVNRPGSKTEDQFTAFEFDNAVPELFEKLQERK